jgi:hypothetical protein
MPVEISTPTLPTRKGGLIFVILFGVVWSGFTLTADWFVFRGAIRQVIAEFYATTTGYITHSGLKEHRGSRGRVDYAPDIKFRYEVAGQAFSGDRYRYGQGYTNDKFAARTIEVFPVGKVITVYYNPNDPADSLLQPGLMGVDLFSALFLVPFNMIVLALWWAVLDRLAARIWKRPAGGARIIDDGFQVRVRLGGSPLVAALVTAGVLGFVSVFPIAFTFGGFNPPMFLMLIVWGVIFTAGLLIFIVKWSKLASGVKDLVIDDMAGTITLPETMGRKESLTIPIASITGFDVERNSTRSSKGTNSTTYVPAIWFAADDGQKRKERIVQWYDEPRAHALATWIGLRIQGRQAV